MLSIVQEPSCSCRCCCFPTAAELKARIMSEYRHQLEVFNDSAEAQALAFQMDLLERRLRVKALRAQRLELYSLSRHHQIGDDVLREVLGGAGFERGEARGGEVTVQQSLM
jgi:CPA1 family monovalent cation:H+ antiporter